MLGYLPAKAYRRVSQVELGMLIFRLNQKNGTEE